MRWLLTSKYNLGITDTFIQHARSCCCFKCKLKSDSLNFFVNIFLKTNFFHKKTTPSLWFIFIYFLTLVLQFLFNRNLKYLIFLIFIGNYSFSNSVTFLSCRLFLFKLICRRSFMETRNCDSRLIIFQVFQPFIEHTKT